MKAVVLVGGEGTRLRPLTYTTPKQLLPIVEIPMIERVLGYLAAHGIKEAVLSLGYRPEAFTREYPDQVAAGVKLAYAVEPEPLDTAGAIRFAAMAAGIEETFIVLNGDILTDADLSALVAFHKSSKAAGTIYLSPVEDPSRFGVVPTDPDGKVIAFVEKPPKDEAPTNLINAGIYVLEPDVLDLIPDGRRVSVERETFPELAEKGALYARADEAYWLDTGTPEAYLRAQSDILAGIRLAGIRGEPPAPGAERDSGGAWVIGAPIVDGSADARSLIGDGALVESGAVVAGSVVGAGCVVGAGATVTGSVLLAGSRVGGGSQIESSIIGSRARVGREANLSGMSIVGSDEVVPDHTVAVSARLPSS